MLFSLQLGFDCCDLELQLMLLGTRIEYALRVELPLAMVSIRRPRRRQGLGECLGQLFQTFPFDAVFELLGGAR
jgi:hypothetical protein